MSSQASSASGAEAAVTTQDWWRRATSTRWSPSAPTSSIPGSVPCELWFLDRAKPKRNAANKVLMLDARNTYRQVTRKIYDFSPEQMQNLTAIVWLYRGQKDRFLALVASYLQRLIDEAKESCALTDEYIEAQDDLCKKLKEAKVKIDADTGAQIKQFKADVQSFSRAITRVASKWDKSDRDNKGLKASAKSLVGLAEASSNLSRQVDGLYKIVEKLVKDSDERGLKKPIKALDEKRNEVAGQLGLVPYFHKQVQWLQEQFPKAELRDVEGLVKLVDRAEIESNDWSLTPGRYVGVAPEEEEEGFNFEETMRDIHSELYELNEEAAVYAVQIQKNFEGFGK